MKRTLSILAIAVMTVGLFAMTVENVTQTQEIVTCDECSRDRDDRENVKGLELACDECSRDRDDREA